MRAHKRRDSGFGFESDGDVVFSACADADELIDNRDTEVKLPIN
jgi:hypothetical protein